MWNDDMNDDIYQDLEEYIIEEMLEEFKKEREFEKMGIYSEEGQTIVIKSHDDLFKMNKNILKLYNLCTDDISKNEIEQVDKLINEAARILGTWDTRE